MKLIGETIKELTELFDGGDHNNIAIDTYEARNFRIFNIHGDNVNLKFQDMPKIAEILGTEHLNFTACAGDEMVDSWSYNGGVVLIIQARDGFKYE